MLVPSPDYPLWTAAVNLNRGRAVHYACRPERGFVPDVEEIERLITRRTRAIVVINPNNPTGAVYPRAVLEGIARLAEQHHLVVFSDEIYDQMLYDGAEFVPMATLVRRTLCATLSGLSKVYRACGYRVGWAVFSGDLEHAARLPGRARAAGVAPPVQQRPGAMGGADRARRPPEHPRAHALEAGDCTNHGARSSKRWRAASYLRVVEPSRRDVCLHRRAPRCAAGLRRSALRDGSARTEARAGRPGQ